MSAPPIVEFRNVTNADWTIHLSERHPLALKLGIENDYESDVDPDTEGFQQYANCSGVIIDTIEQAYWCGPARTWPQEEYNHAYIGFCTISIGRWRTKLPAST